MRRFVLPALLLFLCVGSYAGEDARPLLGEATTIIATPVLLDRGDPQRRRVGRLAFLEGWMLTSPDRAFGSVSAMAVSGRRFTLLSDAGGVMSFDLDAQGKASRARFVNLPAGPGVGAWSKDFRDTESMTIDPATGRAWIGYENVNQIWRYAPGFSAAEMHAAPSAMADWPHESGPEAMVRLRSGRFLLFAESAPGPKRGSNDALLFTSDPAVPGARPIRFGYRRPAGFRVTDVAELPDGRLLILHRRTQPTRLRLGQVVGGWKLVSGIETLVRIVDARGIRAGSVIEGRDIARLAPPLTIENFEALAVTRDANRTIVWIASDDNFAPYQRTLLMKFALDGGQR